MLVLTRKKGESIMVGDDIEIVVVDIDNDLQQVRLGITAPRNTRIYRKEIFIAIKEENRKAARPVVLSPEKLKEELKKIFKTGNGNGNFE